MNVQANFINFYNNIKFDNQRITPKLTAKRVQLESTIRRYLKENGLPTIKEVYNQGSYGVGTGVKPTKGRDFDIDIALVFDIKTSAYKDPTVVKGWVVQAIQRYSQGVVEMLPSCVRVNYKNYHVDLAVYGYNNQVKYLAKGQKGSQLHNKAWEVSPSAKLKEKLKKPALTGEERAQYRRLICYLKRWKDENFKATTNEAPTGIALTVLVYQGFQPQFYKNRQPNDLKALDVVLSQCKSQDYGLSIKLPVNPKNSLFEDINQSTNHRAKYIKQMKALCHAVKVARQATTAAEASKSLKVVFKEDFPLT